MAHSLLPFSCSSLRYCWGGTGSRGLWAFGDHPCPSRGIGYDFFFFVSQFRTMVVYSSPEALHIIWGLMLQAVLVS